MIINGDLESAQLEMFATVNLPTPMKSRVVYDTTRDVALVGNGTKWLPLNGNTPSTIMSALDIDSTISNTFEKSISANSVITLTIDDGKSVVLVLHNTDSVLHTVTFPAGCKWPSGNPQTDIEANKTNLYSILCVSGTFYINSIKDMA